MKKQTEQVALQEIELLRLQLAKTAYQKGFTNSETIHISKILDEALNQYAHQQQDNMYETVCKKVHSN